MTKRITLPAVKMADPRFVDIFRPAPPSDGYLVLSLTRPELAVVVRQGLDLLPEAEAFILYRQLQEIVAPDEGRIIRHDHAEMSKALSENVKAAEALGLGCGDDIMLGVAKWAREYRGPKAGRSPQAAVSDVLALAEHDDGCTSLTYGASLGTCDCRIRDQILASLPWELAVVDPDGSVEEIAAQFLGAAGLMGGSLDSLAEEFALRVSALGGKPKDPPEIPAPEPGSAGALRFLAEWARQEARSIGEAGELLEHAARVAEVVADGLEAQPLRPGQAAFNALHEAAPEIAEAIRGRDADPYHDDARLPAFFRRVVTRSHHVEVVVEGPGSQLDATVDGDVALITARNSATHSARIYASHANARRLAQQLLAIVGPGAENEPAPALLERIDEALSTWRASIGHPQINGQGQTLAALLEHAFTGPPQPPETQAMICEFAEGQVDDLANHIAEAIGDAAPALDPHELDALREAVRQAHVRLPSLAGAARGKLAVQVATAEAALGKLGPADDPGPEDSAPTEAENLAERVAALEGDLKEIKRSRGLSYRRFIDAELRLERIEKRPADLQGFRELIAAEAEKAVSPIRELVHEQLDKILKTLEATKNRVDGMLKAADLEPLKLLAVDHDDHEARLMAIEAKLKAADLKFDPAAPMNLRDRIEQLRERGVPSEQARLILDPHNAEDYLGQRWAEQSEAVNAETEAEAALRVLRAQKKAIDAALVVADKMEAAENTLDRLDKMTRNEPCDDAVKRRVTTPPRPEKADGAPEED